MLHSFSPKCLLIRFPLYSTGLRELRKYDTNKFEKKTQFPPSEGSYQKARINVAGAGGALSDPIREFALPFFLSRNFSATIRLLIANIIAKPRDAGIARRVTFGPATAGSITQQFGLPPLQSADTNRFFTQYMRLSIHMVRRLILLREKRLANVLICLQSTSFAYGDSLRRLLDPPESIPDVRRMQNLSPQPRCISGGAGPKVSRDTRTGLKRCVYYWKCHRCHQHCFDTVVTV